MHTHAYEAAGLMKALAHPARLMVLCTLIGGEKSAGDLEFGTDLGQSALSQHLAVLRERGLVTTRREAQSIYYSIVPGVALNVLQVLHAHYCSAQPPRAALARERGGSSSNRRLTRGARK